MACMNVAERIKYMIASSIKWNAEMSVFIPIGMAQREKDGRSIRTVIKAIIGFFYVFACKSTPSCCAFSGLEKPICISPI